MKFFRLTLSWSCSKGKALSKGARDLSGFKTEHLDFFYSATSEEIASFSGRPVASHSRAHPTASCPYFWIIPAMQMHLAWEVWMLMDLIFTGLTA